MNQQAIGSFLKELRKEKNLTQEALSEQLGVSGRTVSRWETGANLPDLSLLMEMANYYDVELTELLDGKRKGTDMNKETEETVRKVADYSEQEKKVLAHRMCALFVVGCIAMVSYLVMLALGVEETFTGGFLPGMTLGISTGMMVVGVLYTSGVMEKLRPKKKQLVKQLLKK